MSLTKAETAKIIAEYGVNQKFKLLCLLTTSTSFKVTLLITRKITTHVVVFYVWLANVVSF